MVINHLLTGMILQEGKGATICPRLFDQQHSFVETLLDSLGDSKIQMSLKVFGMFFSRSKSSYDPASQQEPLR